VQQIFVDAGPHKNNNISLQLRVFTIQEAYSASLPHPFDSQKKLSTALKVPSGQIGSA
jgi:hypothetical protein